MTSTVASHPDKPSLDYALRSGLAGGLAGCVVCTCLFCRATCIVIFFGSLTGKNGRRTSRQSQDSFPSL